ncbi:hypothetical protein L1049_005364 [Liquidambar formosana]|uniref:WRKY transcription factor n=1 Tax=Liquidambar formosana TaxID=63359 RepID=A0AAP0WZ63_LIQFO
MKKEATKMEDLMESSSFSEHIQSSTYPLSGVFDTSGEEGEKSSLGFMELLGIQDFSPSMFDYMPQQLPSVVPPAVKEYSSETLNLPATPNSSSISSASSEAVNEEQAKAVDEEEEQQKTKKQLKPKKTNQKKQREPRFAFMTKSEVDHLEDGYRWRKYGQKAVKNSPYPRSYYRCTTASCGVKKRVERSCGDPTIVVTTYEGQHTHPSPVMPRGTPACFMPDSGRLSAGGAAANFAMSMPTMTFSYNQQLHQQPHVNNFSPLSFGYVSSSASSASVNDRRFCTPRSALLRDHGLLQDIVPSLMPKEE